jgi:hypothetical protein
MGGWIGGQADYVMVPYADFNLLKFPDKAQAMEKIRGLTCLSDILPTGFHGAVTAKVGVGSTVYVAGRRAGRPRGRSVRARSWRGSRADRRHEQGAARPDQRSFAPRPAGTREQARLRSGPA